MMRTIFLYVTIILIFTGCMFKSVMHDDADGIIAAQTYNYGNNNLLVMLESVYQATSKQSGRGISLTTGFSELRISVYDVADGKLAARKVTGRQTKNPVEFMGCTEGNLWFYSGNDGIHSLDPYTLDVIVRQDSVFKINPHLKGNLANCEWYQIPNYFQFNDISRNVILTDNSGFRHILDTQTLQTRKVEYEYKDFDPKSDRNLEISISIPSYTLMLSGDLRKQLRINNQEIDPAVNFLDGKFIADRDAARTAEGIMNRLSSWMIKMEEVAPEIMDLLAMNNGNGPQWGTLQRDTLRKLEAAKYNIERNIRDFEKCYTEVSSTGYSHSYTQPLSPDTNTFFVFHKANTAQHGHVVISRVSLKNWSEVRELWKTEIPGLFFDPSAARETNEFKEVFSKGSPDFGFSFFGMSGDRLLIVWMLHVQCLDMETGRILWRFRV